MTKNETIQIIMMIQATYPQWDVSKNVDTSELEICTDDGPSYQNVEVRASVDIRNNMFGGRFCNLVFECEEDEKLTKVIHLYESRSNRFRITGFKSELDINSLRHVDEFDILMMRLDRAFCDITDIMEMHDDDVEVEAEPEAYWAYLSNVRVVGNIFDNPELLEEENVHGRCDQNH